MPFLFILEMYLIKQFHSIFPNTVKLISPPKNILNLPPNS